MIPDRLLANLPQYAYTAEHVRENEPRIAKMQHIDMYQLMELAGQSSFALASKLWPKAKTILVVCGRGNNAGDGFILARLALERGFKVYLHSLSTAQDYRGDARLACEKFEQMGGTLVKFNEIDLAEIDYIVDALLGTGLSGEVQENYALVMGLLNQLPQPILSLDIPSGLNADTGQPHGMAIEAAVTVSFVAIKQGMLTGSAKDYCGEIYLSHINIGELFARQIRTDTLINGPHFLSRLSARKETAHKGDSGFVVNIAGNESYPGAARLCSEAALRAGAGLVGLICHPQNKMTVVASRPEIMLLEEQSFVEQSQSRVSKADCIVLGPGLGSNHWAQRMFSATMKMQTPMVVDADGLNLLAKAPSFRHNWILTPHVKEAARLLNCSIEDVQSDRFEAVKCIANKYGGICVLKGPGTLISDGEQIIINLTGNSGMASGGMGDVLSGIIASLSLRSDNLLMAACHGVYLHGKAADLASRDGKIGMLASDLFEHIRALVNKH